MRNFIGFLALMWLIAVTVLLILPGKDLPELDLFGILTDKVIHASVYAGVVLLFSFYVLMGEERYRTMLIYVCLFAILHGIIMEFVQKYFAVNRAFDVLDMLADAIGCVIAFGISKKVFSKKISPCRNRGRNQN